MILGRKEFFSQIARDAEREAARWDGEISRPSGWQDEANGVSYQILIGVVSLIREVFIILWM